MLVGIALLYAKQRNCTWLCKSTSLPVCLSVWLSTFLSVSPSFHAHDVLARSCEFVNSLDGSKVGIHCVYISHDLRII